MLNDPGDDCESVTSRLDPDNVYPGDGSDCRRRKEFHARMTLIRYQILVALWLIMMALPLKMVLRWFLNLKYVVGIPEYFFNI